MSNPTYNNYIGILASLRALMPHRALSFDESLRVAELQANRLLEWFQVVEAPVPTELLTELPRIDVRTERSLPVSGATYWNGTDWVIALNGSEPWTRRRHTLAHEFKHIVDHTNRNLAYQPNKWHSAAEQAEKVADYFAGCLLIPRRQLKAAYFGGMQDPVLLARHFNASVPAIRVRLAQTGLADAGRCLDGAGSSASSGRGGPYYRRSQVTSLREVV